MRQNMIQASSGGIADVPATSKPEEKSAKRRPQHRERERNKLSRARLGHKRFSCRRLLAAPSRRRRRPLGRPRGVVRPQRGHGLPLRLAVLRPPRLPGAFHKNAPRGPPFSRTPRRKRSLRGNRFGLRDASTCP